MTVHKFLGYTIGLTWTIGCLWAGVFLVEALAQEFGDTFGALLPLFMLAWLAVLFIGRSLWETLFSAMFGHYVLVQSSSTHTPIDKFPEQIWEKAFALGLAITIDPVALTTLQPSKLRLLDPNTKTYSEATYEFSNSKQDAA